MDEADAFVVEDFLPFLLNRAAEDSSLAFQKLYKARYGMLRTEWRVLFHLGIYGPLTAKDICQRAKIHKTKISRAVAALTGRRWVVRNPHAADKRAEVLSLTPAGIAVYNDLRIEAQAYDAQLTKRFSAAEVDMLRRMLRQLASSHGAISQGAISQGPMRSE